MNIQIGDQPNPPHVDGQIDNPEFYYHAMQIVDEFHANHNRAMREIEMEELRKKNELKEKNKWIQIWMWIIAVGLFLVCCR